MTTSPTESRTATQSSAQTPTTQARAARTHRSTLTLVLVFITQLMLIIDASIVNVALPDIQRELQFSPTDLSWVVTAYALTFGGLLLASGKIGSMSGAKRALMIGLTLFVIASIVGGLALSSEMLIAARVLQGAGAALAAPSVLVLIMANTEAGASRSRAMSLYVLASGGGAALGLILGGVLTTSLGWEWVFYVNVPIGVIVLAGVAVFTQETTRQRGRIDIGGVIASTVAMVALIFGFTRAAAAGWANSETIISLAIAVVAVAVLILIERRQPSPVVPLRFFASMRSAAPFMIAFLIPAGIYSLFYFTALFTQIVMHYEPIGTGFALLPYVGAMVTMNLITPRIVARLGEKWVASIGLAGLSLGIFWLGNMDTASSFIGNMLAPLILVGLSAGLTFAPMTAMVMSQPRPEEMSAGSSLLQAMQQLGGSSGIALLTGILVQTTIASGEADGIARALQTAALFPALAVILAVIWARRVQRAQ